MPDRQWCCPTCSHVETQPHFVTAVGHDCPARTRPDRKVATFTLVRSA